MRKLWAMIRRGWWGAALVLVLEAPILVYRHVFGGELSTNHTRWSEMGSAMSGIYGPILTALTLFVLIRQVLLQQATNKHMYDQAYLQTARTDSDFYLEQLVHVLDEHYEPGTATRSVLDHWFARATVEDLANGRLLQTAQTLNDRFPRLQAIWGALYPIYSGLSVNDETSYKLQLISCKQKAIVMLSYPTCAALDNYLHCLTQGRIRHAYQFSPALSPPSS
jgi:hypothetical protein